MKLHKIFLVWLGSLSIVGCAADYGHVGSNDDEQLNQNLAPPPSMFDFNTIPSELSYGGSVESMLYVNSETHLDFVISPEKYMAVYMSTSGSDTWFFSSKSGISGYNSCTFNPPLVIVYTHWRDKNVPGDLWHFWGGGGPVCWPVSIFATDLFAGGSNIEFLLIYQNWDYAPIWVYADFDQ